MTVFKKALGIAATVGILGAATTAATAQSIVSFNGPAGEAYYRTVHQGDQGHRCPQGL